jgi:hypothetical protein
VVVDSLRKVMQDDAALRALLGESR